MLFEPYRGHSTRLTRNSLFRISSNVNYICFIGNVSTSYEMHDYHMSPCYIHRTLYLYTLLYTIIYVINLYYPYGQYNLHIIVY